MAVEGVSGAGMTYQGSVSNTQVQTETQAKVASSSNEMASEQIARETMTLSTKQTSADGGGSQTPNQQMDQNSQIKKAVEEINKSVSGNHSEAIFGIHDATNRVTIKIVDKKTKEVIKEYPPEKTLDMIAKVWEIAGLLVDEKR